MNTKDFHYFQRVMFFFATIIVAGCALAIPGFSGNPAAQFKLAITIPCVLAGAWLLPRILTRVMQEMIDAYEHLTGRKVQD